MLYLLSLTLLLAPTYTIRFNVFGLPTNLLMLWVFFIWVFFATRLLLQNKQLDFFQFVKNLDKKILNLITLFFLAGIISLFIFGFSQDKFGQFIVLFLQPISLFFIAAFEWQQNPKAKNFLLSTFYFLLALMGTYSLIQYFTLFGLPAAYWGNNMEPKRAIGFFSHPNFYALFSTPLLAFLLPDLMASVKDKGLRIKDARLWAWLFGALGLLLSLSRAGWLGLGIAGLVYILFAADKQIRKVFSVMVIVIVIVILSVPNLRWRLITPFYGEKSASSRIELWQSGLRAIRQSPIAGLGLTGYQKQYRQLINDPALPDHNFPHNIFLNLWVETGLLGLISFVVLVVLVIYRGLRSHRETPQNNSSYQLSTINYEFAFPVALFLIALITQGLIDNPYFKNDLTLIFWMVLALAL